MSIHRRSLAVFLLRGSDRGQHCRRCRRTGKQADDSSSSRCRGGPDDSSSPEVDQAETAMQHSDFTTAESLLQKAITAKPNDYRAWFDLGYVYNATQRGRAGDRRLS